MNKISQWLTELGYTKSSIKKLSTKIKTIDDVVAYGRKDKKLLHLIFKIYGIHQYNINNCWKLLKHTNDISKLNNISVLLHHHHYKKEALINLYVNILNNGSCLTINLKKFLSDNNIFFEADTEIYVSEKARIALEYISDLSHGSVNDA
jgi:hypothetical protein